MDCRWHYRYAARVSWPECTGTDSAASAAVLRTCLRLSRTQGDTVKLLWWDAEGLYLFAKRLERGHFVWPQAKDGTPARRIKDYLDQANKQFLPGSTEEQIQVGDHTTMIWDSCGKGLAQEGVPMVLIHALDMDHRFWREVFPALATRGRTIAYDMRGHGRARGAPLTKSLEQLAADLAHLLDR
jgi:hypothetical protein